MQNKFRKHQKVKLLVDPNPEYIEYYTDNEIPIKKNMIGKVNVILPNGQYHIEIIDENGEAIAYVLMDETFLESVD
jgi:hypothetical protein